MILSIVSYNTQYCTGLDGKTSVDRIAGEVRHCDIIGLQEIDRLWKRTEMQDQVKRLSELFEDRYIFFGPAIDVDASIRLKDDKIENRRRQFGNMVISRWPIEQARVHLLPKQNLKNRFSLQRSAIDAVIDTPEKRIRLLCTHLGHASDKERLEQIRSLKNIIQTGRAQGSTITGPQDDLWELGEFLQEIPKDTLLLGDFNMTPDSDEYQVLIGTENSDESTIDGLSDLWKMHHGGEGGLTMFDKNPRRLDYIFASNGFAEALQEIRVIEEAAGSDHKPVMAVFYLC